MKKPHPNRLRRAALVSGAVVSVMLVAVWIASARRIITVRSEALGRTIGLSPGCVFWRRELPKPSPNGPVGSIQNYMRERYWLRNIHEHFQWWFV